KLCIGESRLRAVDRRGNTECDGVFRVQRALACRSSGSRRWRWGVVSIQRARIWGRQRTVAEPSPDRREELHEDRTHRQGMQEGTGPWRWRRGVLRGLSDTKNRPHSTAVCESGREGPDPADGHRSAGHGSDDPAEGNRRGEGGGVEAAVSERVY